MAEKTKQKTDPRTKKSHTIEVSHLTKDYGFGRGVFDVSIHVDQGEVFGFLGPNGAGKSTTIRHLMGFSRPDSGSTRIFGLETFFQYDQVLDRVGYIPGEISLPAGLTGWQFIRMIFSEVDSTCDRIAGQRSRIQKRKRGVSNA